MKLRTVIWALLSLLLLACSRDEVPDEPALVIDGSSTVYPIMREAARRFTADHPQWPVAVSFSGTTAGFARFCAGQTDINAASRAINAEELALCNQNQVEFAQYQIAMDAVAIVTHVGNNWLSALTLEQLQQIWGEASEGQVNTWQQVDPGWPARPLSLYGRGEDSGTYDFFTTQLGALRSSRKDYVASEDEEFLARAIIADRNSLGFFGLGAYHRHWDALRLLAIDSGDGPVFPSLETARSGDYAALTRPLFIYVSRLENSRQYPLDTFLSHFFRHVPEWMHHTGYIPLTAEQYRLLLEQVYPAE